MSLCVSVNASGQLISSSTSAQDCTSYLMVDSNEYQLMLKAYEITPLSIAEAFTWGFGTYVSFWFMGYVIKNARSTIKRA